MRKRKLSMASDDLAGYQDQKFANAPTTSPKAKE
jgi:hypothetical protein